MTMYIEELVERISTVGNYLFSPPIATSSVHQSLFYSFSEQMITYGLTEKQKKLCVSILQKYVKELSNDLNIDADFVLKSNLWRTPSRHISTLRQIKIIKKDGRNAHIILFSPYDSNLVKIIKDYKSLNETPQTGVSLWNSENKSWEFPLCEQSVKFFATTSVFRSFDVDPEMFELYQDILEIEKNIENYVPMVTVNSKGQFSYVNVSKNIPQPESTDVINVLLHARKYGITMWSDCVNEMLQSNCSSKLVKKFLELDYQEKISPNTGELLLDDIEPLIKAYENILFIIPVNNEIKYVKKINEFLMKCNYDTDQISVLFRLENSVDTKGLNNYIKESQLNNELSDRIRFVLVGSKLPKPLMESKKKFDLVISFGLNSSHYSLQTFLQNHHNVISMHPISGKNWNHV